VRRSTILDTSVDVVFHAALLFSVFLLFAGHNAPGGGFVGGLVCGAALVLRFVRGGAAEVRSLVRIAPAVVLGVGLLLAGASGLAGFALGGEIFESGKLDVEVPLLGHVKATSALPFDIGVYLVVVGLALDLLRSLGSGIDRQVLHEQHALTTEEDAWTRT
jgi:multicomponent Na+:H+ antiporter subunit A